jgi:hypothetical protein
MALAIKISLTTAVAGAALVLAAPAALGDSWAADRKEQASVMLSPDLGNRAAAARQRELPRMLRERALRAHAQQAVNPLDAAVLSVSGAAADDVPARLNEVAHVYSLGVGEVRCPAQAEWEAYYGSAFAWGSTNLREDYATLAPFICEGAMSVGGSTLPLWQQAAGVWVLVHEAFHLRHWRLRRDEAKVACQAIVYFRDAAMRLGASEEQAEELYPYALALHIRQTKLFSWYRDRNCPVPLWVPPVP